MGGVVRQDGFVPWSCITGIDASVLRGESVELYLHVLGEYFRTCGEVEVSGLLLDEETRLRREFGTDVGVCIGGRARGPLKICGRGEVESVVAGNSVGQERGGIGGSDSHEDGSKCGSKTGVASFDKKGVLNDVKVGNVTMGSCRRGPNYERNKLSREAKKKAKEARGAGYVGKSGVPEWRGKGTLADTWEQRKIRENRIAIMRADEQIRRLELGVGKKSLQAEVLSSEEMKVKVRESYEEEMKAIRSRAAKHEADELYWKKRQDVGAVEKAVELEMEIINGQISGKYDPFASRRMIGWAKTVRTNSSTGSSAAKTVWSGSGASGLVEGSAATTQESIEMIEKRLKSSLEREAKEYKKRVLAESKALEGRLRCEIKEAVEKSKYMEEQCIFFKKKAMNI